MNKMFHESATQFATKVAAAAEAAEKVEKSERKASSSSAAAVEKVEDETKSPRGKAPVR